MTIIDPIKRFIKSSQSALRILRWLNEQKKPSIVILRYHSIKKDSRAYESFMGKICHEDMDFAEHMHIIAHEFDPVSMDDVYEMACGKISIPKRGVAVTFDDGFADNCEIAMPCMDAYGIKGTVYVTTGYVESGAPLWFMRLRHAFHESTAQTFQGHDAVYDLRDPNGRRQAHREAASHLARLTADQQDAALSEIEKNLEIKSLTVGDRVVLSWEHMQRLVQNGHLIGCHTRSHPNVAHISEEEFLAEVLQSKQDIEQHLGITVKHFAYPRPILRPYFTAATQTILSDCGFKTAATCEPGVYCGGGSMCLPRIIVPIAPQDVRWGLELTKFRHAR